MANIVKIAAVQMNPELMKPQENLEAILSSIRKAAENRAQLIVFPECCLSGYVFQNRQEALPFAETVPGLCTEKLVSVCNNLNVYVIMGLLEKSNDRLFNVAVLTGPDGLIGSTAKTTCPFWEWTALLTTAINHSKFTKPPLAILVCLSVTILSSPKAQESFPCWELIY